MYNFNAETWVITYPHGAGGRLLELILSLDSDMCGLDKNTQKSQKSQKSKFIYFHLDPSIVSYWHPVMPLIYIFYR